MSLWEKKISPMLAFQSEPFDDSNFLFEVKFDGTRSITYIDTEKREIRLLNRRGIWFQDRYPELKEIWKNVKGKRVIVDGEVCVFKEGNPDFYLLEEREHTEESIRIELLSKKYPATLIVFDILHKDGKDLIELPLIERKKILEETIKESTNLLLSIYVVEKGKKFFEEVKRRGLEGIMAKRLNATYQIGKRSKDWLKIKYLKTLDCVICGFTEGEGWRKEYFGALVLGVFDKGKLRYVGRVGTGLSEEGYAKLTRILKKLETGKNPFDIFEEEPSIVEKIHWVKPKLVCEVKFMELTEDKKLRAPSFIRLRTDKRVEECVLEA